MTTPNDIYVRLQNDFDCRLSVEQFLSILNVLEKRLAVDVVKRKIIYESTFSSTLASIDIDAYAENVTKIFLDGVELKEKSLSNLDGYTVDGNNIVFANPIEGGTLLIERIYVPQDYDENSMLERPLLLCEGYDEIYLYHILSREALMNGDIDMVNNYSLLYAQALASLKEHIDEDKSEDTETENSEDEKDETEGKSVQEKYKNIW